MTDNIDKDTSVQGGRGTEGYDAKQILVDIFGAGVAIQRKAFLENQRGLGGSVEDLYETLSQEARTRWGVTLNYLRALYEDSSVWMRNPEDSDTNSDILDMSKI